MKMDCQVRKVEFFRVQFQTGGGRFFPLAAAGRLATAGFTDISGSDHHQFFLPMNKTTSIVTIMLLAVMGAFVVYPVWSNRRPCRWISSL